MTRLDHALTLLSNEKVAPDTHVLRFRGRDLPDSTPGQFYNLKTPYYLRRPLGIMSQDGDEIAFGVKIVGKGSRALAELKPGFVLKALGPLGRGFRCDDLPDDGWVQLVGGGTGIFPLMYLAACLSARISSSRIRQIYGFRSVEDSFLCDRLRALAPDTRLASDAGGLDFFGHGVACLEDELVHEGERPCAIFTCGPMPMMQGVVEVARRYDIPVWVSLETRMGCGIGLCRGCSVDLRDSSSDGGVRRVRCCKEGPVFAGEAVIWA